MALLPSILQSRTIWWRAVGLRSAKQKTAHVCFDSGLHAGGSFDLGRGRSSPRNEWLVGHVSSSGNLRPCPVPIVVCLTSGRLMGPNRELIVRECLLLIVATESDDEEKTNEEPGEKIIKRYQARHAQAYSSEEIQDRGWMRFARLEDRPRGAVPPVKDITAAFIINGLRTFMEARLRSDLFPVFVAAPKCSLSRLPVRSDRAFQPSAECRTACCKKPLMYFEDRHLSLPPCFP